MNEDADRLERRIAERLRERREMLGWSLDRLASESGVSRAMIARIERQESSPTAGLLGKLCNGLGVTLSAVMAEAERPAHAVARRAAQLVWQDPETNYRRRLVSPPATHSEVEIVEVQLPAGARVAYDPSRTLDYDQHVLVEAGALTLELGAERLELAAGDCAHMTLEDGLVFKNDGDDEARYLVILRRAERMATVPARRAPRTAPRTTAPHPLPASPRF